MNEINVGEVFYIIAKTRSLERAEDFLHRLETLLITPVSNTFTDVLEAARVKAQFPRSRMLMPLPSVLLCARKPWLSLVTQNFAQSRIWWRFSGSRRLSEKEPVDQSIVAVGQTTGDNAFSLLSSLWSRSHTETSDERALQENVPALGASALPAGSS